MADKGSDELTGGGELMDAWAVLTEIEDVGGPDEKIDRLGVLNSVVCCAEPLGVARSNSGTDTERE